MDLRVNPATICTEFVRFTNNALIYFTFLSLSARAFSAFSRFAFSYFAFSS